MGLIDALEKQYNENSKYPLHDDWSTEVPALESLAKFGSSQKVREKAFQARYGVSPNDPQLGYRRPVWAYSSDDPEDKQRLIQEWLYIGGGEKNVWFSAAVNSAIQGRNSSEVYWTGESAGAQGGLNGVIIADIPDGLKKLVLSIYNDTQEYYKKNPKKVPKVLYRGVTAKVTTSSPVESWTAAKSTANKFDGYSVFAKEQIRPEDIFMSYEATAHWLPEEQLKGKKEYTLIGGTR